MRVIRNLFIAACFTCQIAGCGTPYDKDQSTAQVNAPEPAAGTQQQALLSGRVGGGGGVGVGSSCVQCLVNYNECGDDSGGDAELIALCKWELGVCNRFCSGPIIAIR